jgi:hypothetical protein
VLAHVDEVLANVDRMAESPEQRARLRVIALVHDTFKGHKEPHQLLARRFAERYIDDPGALLVIERHDAPYGFWRRGRRTGDWEEAERRARALAEELGDELDLFTRFHRADTATGDKSDEPLRWFESVVSGRA